MNFLVLILAFVCHMDLVVYTFQNRSRVLHILRANSRRVKIHRKKLSINSTTTSTPSSQAKMFEEIISTTTLPTTQTLSTPIQKLGQSEESTPITTQPPTSTTQSRVKMLYKLRMDAKKRNLTKTTTPLSITSTNTTEGVHAKTLIVRFNDPDFLQTSTPLWSLWGTNILIKKICLGPLCGPQWAKR